jgi:hypothetical protein
MTKLKPKKCLGMHKKEEAFKRENKNGTTDIFYVCTACGKEFKKTIR